MKSNFLSVEGGSEKHLRDIRAILEISGEQLNQTDLKEWVQRQGVEVEWRKLLESK